VIPELPGLNEVLPGVEIASWFGILAPPRTPRPIADALHREVANALAARDVREALLGLGMEPVGSSPSAFAAFIASEVDKWAQVVREAGIKAE
jgi:tripartite-type tricarboxylate transporter receptor subunit TctC